MNSFARYLFSVFLCAQVLVAQVTPINNPKLQGTGTVVGTLAPSGAGTITATGNLTLNTIGTTQGAVLYRNATSWVLLPPGTAGFVLASGGAAANPSWVDNGAGSVTSVGLTMPGIFAVAGSPITSTGTLAVTATGTSGGVPYFNSATTLASSGALGANQLLLGGGAGAAPTSLGSTGTTTTVLHGNASGAPTFGAVSLTADVTGTLPVGNGGTGVATITTNAVITGNGTGAVGVVAPGTSGNILTSNGTAWNSAAPATSGNVTAAGTLDSGNIVIGQGAKTIATSSVISISGSNATVTGNLAITGSTTFNNLTTSNLTVTGNIVGNLAATQVTVADSADYFAEQNAETVFQEIGASIVALQSSVGPPPSGNQLNYGGGVALAPAGGLDITVSAANYSIQGTIYNSVLTNLTLSAADPTNPRIDVVAVNSSGNAVIITGTAAATPAKPDVDPSTQLELTFFLVTAAATDLDVDVVDVYLNNAEWTTSTNSAGTINIASTNNPYTGAVCIEGTTVTTGNYVRFVKPASGTFDLADSDNLVFYIRSKASWATNRLMTITIRNASSVQLGSAVTFDQGLFGFNSGQTTTYQQIIIPTALFAANGLTASQIQITLGGSGGTVGFYIDDVTLQGGVSSITDAYRMKWRGNYLASNFYNVNDVVLSSGIQYVAIQAGVGNTPVSSATFWQPSSTSTGGTVTVSGTPTSGQLAQWTSAINVQGITSANVTQGGTGLAALTANNIITGNGTGAVTFIAPGTSGNVVTSNGTAWLSSAAASGNVTGSSLTANAVIVGNGTNSLGALASLGTAGHALVSAGAGAPPAFAVVGIVGGGTGLATITANSIFIGNGTSTPILLAPGTSGNVVTSNGTAWTSAAASGGGGSLTKIQWSAADNQPPASAYATFGTRNSVLLLNFDADTDEDSVFVGNLPEGTSLTTGLSVYIKWTAATATSGNCVWVGAWERCNTDIDSDSFATGISVTTATSGTSGIPNTTQIDFNGTTEIDGLTVGDMFRLKVTRDANSGSDTMTGDAQILTVEVRQR